MILTLPPGVEAFFDEVVQQAADGYESGISFRKSLFGLMYMCCKEQRAADYQAFGSGQCHEPIESSPIVVAAPE